MKQPNPQRWAEYMHECAERCRRQLAAAQVRAGIGAVELPGHERPLGWYEGALRRGCSDEV